MTPFAAGCAVCGFDLEDWRRRPQPAMARARGRIQVPRLSADRRNDVLLVVVLFFLIAFAPILGALIAGLVAFAKQHGNLDGQIAAFFVMVVAAAEVVVGLAIIMTIFRTRRSASVDDASLLKY